MGWMIIDDLSSDLWFRAFQSIRNYMFIIRNNDNIYDTKMDEALSTYDDMTNIPDHKRNIRYTFELIEMIKDKLYDRIPYDLNYK